jgi:hypothetical protein
MFGMVREVLAAPKADVATRRATETARKDFIDERSLAKNLQFVTP